MQKFKGETYTAAGGKAFGANASAEAANRTAAARISLAMVTVIGKICDGLTRPSGFKNAYVFYLGDRMTKK